LNLYVEGASCKTPKLSVFLLRIIEYLRLSLW
jgi:hypothetical protein